LVALMNFMRSRLAGTAHSVTGWRSVQEIREV
jgi:hypothetical protein